MELTELLRDEILAVLKEDSWAFEVAGNRLFRGIRTAVGVGIAPSVIEEALGVSLDTVMMILTAETRV